MVVDVAQLRAGASVRVGSLTAGHALVAIVGASIAVRLVLALALATPYIFPDEYIYSSLAHELAESGRPFVRDGASFFPGLVAPLLVAPFQLVADPALAYRLTQAAFVVWMSLAAVPAFALARRVGLSSAAAVAVATITVAVPDLVYSSFMLAEPVAYPLALAAVYAGVRTLERPTWRAQLAFLALVALTTGARLQYAALFVAFVVAAAIVERRALRLPLAAVGAALAGTLAVGVDRVLGPYRGLFDWDPELATLTGWTGSNLLLLTWAAGAAIGPAAVAGLVLSLGRPRARADAAFGAMTTAFGALLVLEAAMIADFESNRFEERYLFVLVPLLAIAALLWVTRGRPGRALVAAGAAASLLLAFRLPISGYVVSTGEVDSPFLWSIARVARATGIETASLIVATSVAAASVVAAAAAYATRRALALLVAATLAALVAISAGAHAYAIQNAAIVRAQDLPAQAGWVDRTGLENVALLQTPGGPRRGAMEALFWNRTIEDILVVGAAAPLDAFGAGEVRVRRDGTLVLGGHALTRPLLVQTYGVMFELRDAERIGRGGTFELWRPSGPARLALFVAGRYHDGWLAPGGAVVVWPKGDRLRGVLRLRVGMPAGTRAVPVDISGDGGERRIVVRPGERLTVEVPLDLCGPATVRFRALEAGYLSDKRAVGVRGDRPVFVPIQGPLEPCR